MLRTSKHILKYQNKKKHQLLLDLFVDFKSLVELYVSMILKKELPLELNLSSKLLPSSDKISASRYKQVAYKTASEIIRSTQKKIEKKVKKRYGQLYYKCIKSEKHPRFTNMRFSHLTINYLKRVKIDVKDVSLNLDSRLFEIQPRDSGAFDEFVHLRLPWFQEDKKRAISINIPIKHHRQSLKFKTWNRRKTIQLQKINNQMFLSIFWEKEEAQKREPVKKVGIDIGYKKLLATSTGNLYGSDLNNLYLKISGKKQGSKNFLQLLKHRDQLTNFWTKKMVAEESPDLVFIEDLKKVKHKSKLSHKVNNKLQRWSYPIVIRKLEALAEEEGFCLKKVNPAYTSQTCSNCGTVEKTNRKGESYRCSCGMEMDADLNAAINVLHRGEYGPSNTYKNLMVKNEEF